MTGYDTIIIGSGLGGLACGAMLSKEGMKVCVVEKNAVTGGCLQSFRRAGRTLDTGIHYVGSMHEGQVLNQYMKYFGVLPDLRIRELDPAGFDVIHLEGREFRHAVGFNRFTETLAAEFPAERAGIEAYCRTLQQIGSLISPEVLRTGKLSAGGGEYLGIPAAATIDSLVKDPLLRRVLAGSASLYGGRRDMSPLYHHAMINHSNIEGACSFAGGTQHIADALAARIRSCGGEIRTCAEATRLRLDGSRIRGVEINGGEQTLEAKYIISDAPPAVTFGLVEPTPLLKRAFLSRLSTLPNTYGLFTVYLLMKPGTTPYRNCNHYFYNTPDVWSAEGDFEGCNIPMVLMCMQPAVGSEYTEVVTLLVPMAFDTVQRWAGTRPGKRGADYEAFKTRYTEKTVRFVERFLPGLGSAAERICTSSPLTYLDYTAVPGGAAYGMQKDFNRPVSSLIPVRSKIGNLLLTGQNLNVHGMLGVTVSAAVTCSELLGEAYLAKKIGNA